MFQIFGAVASIFDSYTRFYHVFDHSPDDRLASTVLVKPSTPSQGTVPIGGGKLLADRIQNAYLKVPTVLLCTCTWTCVVDVIRAPYACPGGFFGNMCHRGRQPPVSRMPHIKLEQSEAGRSARWKYCHHLPSHPWYPKHAITHNANTTLRGAQGASRRKADAFSITITRTSINFTAFIVPTRITGSAVIIIIIIIIKNITLIVFCIRQRKPRGAIPSRSSSIVDRRPRRC